MRRIRFNHGETRLSQQAREHGSYRAWDDEVEELIDRIGQRLVDYHRKALADLPMDNPCEWRGPSDEGV